MCGSCACKKLPRESAARRRPRLVAPSALSSSSRAAPAHIQFFQLHHAPDGWSMQGWTAVILSLAAELCTGWCTETLASYVEVPSWAVHVLAPGRGRPAC